MVLSYAIFELKVMRLAHEVPGPYLVQKYTLKYNKENIELNCCWQFLGIRDPLCEETNHESSRAQTYRTNVSGNYE